MVWWVALVLWLALVAVVGLAWRRWMMRSDDELGVVRGSGDPDLQLVLLRGDDRQAEDPAEHGDSGDDSWSDRGDSSDHDASGCEAELDPEPGEEYADELHRIGLEAAADSWRYDSLAILTRMPRHWITYGYSGDDWLRCLLPHAEYMAELDRSHRAWLERWGAEQASWKARQLRGIRKYRGLGAAA